MGNASLNPEVFRQPGITPPISPPAQPGEVRGCFTCVRASEFKPWLTQLEAVCEWRWRWDRPVAGCDRWAMAEHPIASPMPGLKDPPVLEARGGKPKATKRRR